MTILLHIHAFATCFMTGLIWFVQVVHYPMFRDVGCQHFAAYEAKHSRLTTLVVAPVMLVELATSVLLVTSATDTAVNKSLAGWGLGLVAVIWVSTALLQVPMHRKLESGFDMSAWKFLVNTNWIRTVAWSARGIVAVALLK